MAGGEGVSSSSSSVGRRASRRCGGHVRVVPFEGNAGAFLGVAGVGGVAAREGAGSVADLKGGRDLIRSGVRLGGESEDESVDRGVRGCHGSRCRDGRGCEPAGSKPPRCGQKGPRVAASVALRCIYIYIYIYTYIYGLCISADPTWVNML